MLDARRNVFGRKGLLTTNLYRQLVLDGFEHLQIAYTFEREGRTVLVPVDQCSEIELERRAREYDDMANGCRAHSRELREYIATRNAPTPSEASPKGMAA